MIQQHKPQDFEKVSINGATVDVGTYNLSQNKIGKVKIDVFIVDNVSGDFGIGEYEVSFRRYTGPNAVIGSVHVFVPLQTPGTLAGASVSVVDSGSTVTGRFTGVAGRTITVWASFRLTTVQF